MSLKISIIFFAISILIGSCVLNKRQTEQRNVEIYEDDRIPVLDSSGNQKIDLFGNPMYRYPDKWIEMDSLKLIVVQPDCDSTNGSIKVSYPNITEHYFIEWTDFNKNPLNHFDGMYELKNLGIGGYSMKFGNRTCCLNYGEKLEGKLNKSNFIVTNKTCKNSLTTDLIIEFRNPEEKYIVSWNSLTESDTVNAIFKLKNAKIGETFNFLIENKKGCQVWEDLTIDGTTCPESYEINLLKKVHSSNSSNNGMIEIEIDSTRTDTCLMNSYYVDWTIYDYGLKYENLYRGEYCVTITNNSNGECRDCKTVKCYNIE